MSKTMKIYLAGPEVFLPNAIEVLKNHQKLCQELGFIGLSPLDNELKKENLSGIQLAKKIFLSNVELIKQCDIVAANINFFRGGVIDDGTAWEIGYAHGLGKIIFGYLDAYIPLIQKTKQKIKTIPHSSGYYMDEDGYLLNEDFGNSVNLMIEYSIETSGGKIIEGKFKDCLLEIKNQFIN